MWPTRQPAEIFTMLYLFCLTQSVVILGKSASGFTHQIAFSPRHQTRVASHKEQAQDKISAHLSRRQMLLSVGISSVVAIGNAASADSKDLYVPAKRPTAYRVDSTIPPTLIPLNAQREIAILSALGKGSGTSKEAVIDNAITLNNMMNKAVFGAINGVSSLLGTNPDDKMRRGTGYASFVCLGLPKETTAIDVDLAASLLSFMLQARNSNSATALGLAFAPLSTQSALDEYRTSGNEAPLIDAMTAAGVSEYTLELHMPLLKFARSKKTLDVLAMSPEFSDIRTVRSDGLQNLNVDRRSNYVVDSEGFINQTVDKRFRMYTERSLQKDFVPSSTDDMPGNFFAEKILVHEAAATVAARYAVTRPDSFVALVAPTPEVRYLCGINGRIPRICKFLQKDENKVTEDAVTTILLNPTAKETLSLSRKLRLEIGTAPENIDVQTKVADYLWFSSIPKVSLIPRLMNA